MNKPRVSIIVAMDKKRGIGKSNALPWYIPDDLKRFRKLTTGHPVIMGRKTFESIIARLGKPLPKRTNIIVTRNPQIGRSWTSQDDVIIAGSLEEALDKARGVETIEIFIIGGGQIFEQSLAFVDRLYVTLVDAEFDADVFFPDYSDFKKAISQEKGQSNGLSYTFLTLDR